MLYVTDIPREEVELLKKHYKKSQCTLIRERAHAVLLSSQERSVSDIAAILMRAENTIRQWIQEFQERRMSSIFHQYQGHMNASKLTKEQKEEIKRVLNQRPSERGLPKAFWDVPSLKAYMKAEFDTVYESDRSYHYLLRFGGLSFKLPVPFDERRDKNQINNRLEEIFQEINPYLQDSRWEIFAADETRITWEAEIRRAWLAKNIPTVVKVHRDNQYQNFFGAWNLKTHAAHTFRLDWQNQQTIIDALKGLMRHYPHKKICVIWDNARWHKGKVLREELQRGRALQHVHLINFPPYAPDVNPQERIWKYAKEQIANGNVPDTFEQTIDLFERSIQLKIFNYKITEFVLR